MHIVHVSLVVQSFNTHKHVPCLAVCEILAAACRSRLYRLASEHDPCRIYWHAGTTMEKAVVNQLRCFFTEIWVSTVIHNSIHSGLTLGRLWIHSKPLWKFSQPIHRHFHSMEKSMDPCGFAILYVKTTSYQSPFHSPMEIYFYQAMEVASWGSLSITEFILLSDKKITGFDDLSKGPF